LSAVHSKGRAVTADRREFFKWATAAAGVGSLAACGPRTSPGSAPAATAGKITSKTFAEAEKLLQLAFTDKERTQMLGDFEQDLEWLTALRQNEFADDLAPALTFDPRIPGKRVEAQKNVIALGGAVTAALPADEADIAFASVAQQGAWLRAKSISSVRLAEIYLKRIEKHDPALHAFITVTSDRAMAEAAAADKAFADGQDKGPLHGIPYALKDLADTKGVKTTWGAELWKDRVPDEDAEVVRKLQRAGAVLLGKSSCGAIAYGDLWFGARTRNPWNPEEGSSGSSAGSASAVAAGLASFGVGTETLGSIISPSERCGATGLRPTFGRVSRAGFMALCWSLDKVGPICRTVEDTALVLSEINGFDADDAAAGRMGFSYDGKVDIKGMRVGYVPEFFEKGDEVDRAALEALKGLGVALAPFPWPKTDYSPLSQIVVVEAAAAFSDLTLQNTDDQLAWQEPQAWPNTWRKARFVSAVDYVQVDRLRRRLMQEMSAAFEGFDALIGPHFSGGALLMTNCTGQPQLNLRAGFAQTKTRTIWGADDKKADAAKTFRTPRGISLWADIYEERKIIALGRALEAKLAVASERPKGF
jgi:Asp-tRNA(Asn)/Glu-tRNA(Gln) amidotransferase A subunit family amidase